MNSIHEQLAATRSPRAVRSSCKKIYDACLEGKTNFSLNLDQLEPLADQVIEVTRKNYPNLDIPFHSRMRHFAAGGVDRLSALSSKEVNPEERCRQLFDLILVSVLLDAGAGPEWSYQERSGQSFQRSEGLAIASFHMFQEGLFSMRYEPEVSGEGLRNLPLDSLEHGFQSRDGNQILGLEGRHQLLQNLGHTMKHKPHIFIGDRPGGLYDYILEKFGRKVKAIDLMVTVIEACGDIWPGRHSIHGQNLGDAWPHPLLAEEKQPTDRFVIFHKLSQWLSYSLMEPLFELGIEVLDIDEMTGLAEYRNGGLFVDGGVLKLRDESLLQSSHNLNSELIVEWRALTVILLDAIAPIIRKKLSSSAIDLPLVKILEGGTWWAGRQLAAEKRSDGTPPFQLLSDGTIF